MWKQREYNKEIEQTLIRNGKNKLLSRILSERNIDISSLDDFTKSEYKNMSNSYFLHDIEKSVKIFTEICKKHGNCKIISDIDCDGIIAATMIKELCNVLGLNCSVFLPSRKEFGYGLNEKSTKAFIEMSKKEKDKIDLLFVLDSGSNCFKEIEEIRKKLKCKIIIIDHHLIDNEKLSTNADAIISWHLGGKYEMCTCGEIYQFIRAINKIDKRVSPKEYISLAAISTIADVCPIIGDNRIIVKNGLTSYALSHVSASGLSALMKQSKINVPSLNISEVSFKIVPKINAAGRIYNPDIVYYLLTERNPDIAYKMAEEIGSYNEERKNIQKQIEEEAVSYTECNKDKFTHGILLTRENWHIGVVGIVASKIVEKYNKPTIVIGNNNGIWKGSGRSVKGINLKEILDLCPEIFESYGGHSGAVGVTLNEKCRTHAAQIFNETCKKYFEKNKINQEQYNYYDAKLSVSAINPKISDMLHDNLYPYCVANNSEPIFMLPDATIHNVTLKEGDGWKLLKFYADRETKVEYPFKTFSHKFNSNIEGRRADIYFTFPQKNEIPNQFSQFELFVVDIVLK